MEHKDAGALIINVAHVAVQFEGYKEVFPSSQMQNQDIIHTVLSGIEQACGRFFHIHLELNLGLLSWKC